MRFKRKEKEKLLSRRKLWSLFKWSWAYKKKNGVTHYTTNESDGGIGYFKNNHSLNCGCGKCKEKTFIRRQNNKSKRLKNKKKVRELMKIIKGKNKLD